MKERKERKERKYIEVIRAQPKQQPHYPILIAKQKTFYQVAQTRSNYSVCQDHYSTLSCPRYLPSPSKKRAHSSYLATPFSQHIEVIRAQPKYPFPILIPKQKTFYQVAQTRAQQLSFLTEFILLGGREETRAQQLFCKPFSHQNTPYTCKIIIRPFPSGFPLRTVSIFWMKPLRTRWFITQI